MAGIVTGGRTGIQRGAVPCWVSGEGGAECNGGEQTTKANCKTKRGEVRERVVKAKIPAPDQEYTVTLIGGESSLMVANKKGKSTFKLGGDNAPPCGGGTAMLTPSEDHECATEDYDYDC